MIGASFGQFATGHSALAGSMHRPDTHLIGVSKGHPAALGHLLSEWAQEPSGHSTSLPGHLTVMFEQVVLEKEHDPSKHLNGLL